MHAGRADTLYGLVMAAISAALIVHTFSDAYEFNPLIESVSTVFFPRIILGGILLCSLGLIVKGLRNRDPDDQLDTIDKIRVFLVLAACAATAAGLWFIGYFYAMPVGVFLTGVALGYPNKTVLAVTAIVATALTWVALGYFANVIFPTQFRLF